MIATPFTPARPPCAAAKRRNVCLSALAVLLAASAGCQAGLETKYGKRTGPEATHSVNGTSVLGDMFADAGYRVDSRGYLSPNLETAQTIVWFPDDFEPPKPNVVAWFDEWLAGGEERTLIYVGRDFDAAPLYWRKMRTAYPPEDKKLADQNLVESRGDHDIARQALKDGECPWFNIKASKLKRDVRTLAGPWSEGVDPSKVEIQLHSRIVPSEYADVLLRSDGDVIVSREEIDEAWAQVIVVANGSFLLNMALVNHEHRRLAGKLIDCVADEGRVVFLESRPGGPKIVDSEPAPRMHTGLEILYIWPMSAILLHFVVLGIIFCFARWPIFGRAAELDAEPASDFGRHVEALGKLLEQSGDQEYAQAKMRNYRDKV